MNQLLKTTILGGIALLSSVGVAISQQADQTNEVMFVLDGSNSMWGQIDGTAKISIAKDVMTDLITNLDPNVNMGLMAYGHRRKNDCQDIQVLATPGPVDRQRMIEHVQNITPRGKTPISKALLLGAVSVGYFTGKSSVVLVSDGLETCDADPCAQARSLGIVNPGFDVHVVGFDVTKEESESLQCIADATGGKFFRANNASELKDALAQTVAAVQNEPEETFKTNLYAKLCETCERLDPLEVRWNITKDGKQHYEGIGAASSSQALFVQTKYQVEARLGTSVVTATGEIEFGDDGEQVGELNLNAGSARIFAYATDDKVTPQEAFFRFFPIVDGKAQGELDVASGNDRKTWLPAGLYKVTAQINKIEASAEIEIIAGQETTHEFDLRAGYIRPDVVLFEGGKINRDMFYRLLDADTGGVVAATPGRGNEPIPAKPGKYNLQVQYNSPNFIGHADINFPVEIKAGETISGPYVMNVGRFEYNITSKSGSSIGGVWLNRVSEDGKSSREIDFSRYAKFPGVAPEGTYNFRVRVGDNFLTTGPFEIVAGEVRDLNIEFP